MIYNNMPLLMLVTQPAWCLYAYIYVVHMRDHALSLYLFHSGPTLLPLTMATKKNRMGTCRLATWPGISKPQAVGTESRLTEKV